MSAHTRTLDRIAALVGERPVDALFIVRRRALHWPLVGLGLMLGAAAGMLVPADRWFFVPAGVIVLGGLGMNLGTDFRFIARTPSRVLLLDSSRVRAWPSRLVRSLAPADVQAVPSRLVAHLDLSGEPHLMGRAQLPRLGRLLHGAP